ncbi:ComEC/Rec2 family competence protein [Mycoplasma bradburyae]|uniref:ComEC/Rec2 family competence protein n=1 Tax=Mycoplasma bradburyae TaxID=2963128 RepID=UPI00234218CA|nr:ComEC/Rec2 family competence protein [Mycoplasma bradburyae]MDC4182351.1 ComEC/Rec2 family competence protein [Mycoplasma bradburyae]
MELKRRINIKENYGLALMFCLVSIWLLGYTFNKQQWILIGILGVVFCIVSFFLFNCKIAIFICVLFVLFLGYYLIYYFLDIKGVSFKELLDRIPEEYDLRKIILKYLNTNERKQSRGFLLLTIFNIRNNDNRVIYNQILNLSIAHLLVVSGLHLSLINITIQKIFKKSKIIGNFVSFPVLIFYCYLLSFSYGVTRILLCLFINLILKKIIKEKDISFLVLAISGLVLLLFNPYAFLSYSYMLSYLSVSVITAIYQIEKINNFAKSIISSVLINIVLGGLIINGYGKINLLTIFWSIILSPIIMSIYFLNLFLFPFNVIWPYLEILHNVFFIIIKTFQINYFVINLSELANWTPYYYLLIYYLFISNMWVMRLI